MIRFVLLIGVIILILFILSKKSNKNKTSQSFYKKIILILIILGLIFLLATSGRYILPQIMQILKIGLPFLTKFIGI